MMRRITTVMCAGAVLTMALSCEKPNGGDKCTAPADGRPIELISPQSGTFKVGQTVPIEFKFDKNEVAQVMPQVYDPTSLSWKTISDAGIGPEDDGQYQCMTYSWVIGTESEAVDYTAGSDAFKVRIAQYGNVSVNDASGNITINPQ